MKLTRAFKTRARRATVLGALMATLFALTGTTAHADPVGDLLRQAQSILARGSAGEPLQVVVTTRTADAPSIKAISASSAANALQLITGALQKSSTIGVEMAQPVHMTASNDPYRSSQWGLTMFGAETL